jgi:hypothetical protein
MANTFYPVIPGSAIVEGPSKFDLMVSVFKKDEQVQFTAASRTGRMKIQFPFLANSVEPEDSSKERWIITGYTFDTNGRKVDASMRLYYDCRSRTGHVIDHVKIA